MPAEFKETGNFDVNGIVTPIKLNSYRGLLEKSKFNKEKSAYLLEGFKNGFAIGYRGPPECRDSSRNIPIRDVVSSETIMWEKLMKEVELGRHAGPFNYIPYSEYIQSPTGLVPKAGNKTRLIFHLSYDFGPEPHQKSVNFFTPDEFCSVKYNDLDNAVRSILHLLTDGNSDCPELVDSECVSELEEFCELVGVHRQQFEGHNFEKLLNTRQTNGKGAHQNCSPKPVFMAKSDLMGAFRILPVLPEQRKYLIMKAKNPKSGKYMFFVEKNLPFGASVSCARFQLFSDSLRHIIEFLLDRQCSVTNYLDDYMFISLEQEICNNMVRIFLHVCQQIGCPVAIDKTEWASVRMVFLGVLLDGVKHCLCIPQEKKEKAEKLLNWVINKRKVTVKFTQQLAGVLNFLAKAIVPGRTFIRGMYRKIHTKNAKGEELKQYHHLAVDKEFISDCKVWKEFLEQKMLIRTLICRPFSDLSHQAKGVILNFYSDASMTGMGALFRNRWMAAVWDLCFWHRKFRVLIFWSCTHWLQQYLCGDTCLNCKIQKLQFFATTK